MKDKKRRGLGRGLSTLMADVALDQGPNAAAETPAPAERMLPIEQLKPNPDQPRTVFAEDKLQELAASISERGVIQPLIVRQQEGLNEQYEIVAGERRWRAAQIAQLHEVPVIIRSLSDTEVLEVAIIENIQRADLGAIEEALGYKQLIDRFSHTQDQVSKALGKSRSHIANMMRLLTLPDDVQTLLQAGKISAGHARALITSKDPSALAKQVVAKGLSVRDTEKLAASDKPKVKPRETVDKDADTRALEQDLSANLGLKVTIDHKDGGDGALTLRYQSLEQLDALCRVLSATPLDVTR